MRLIDADALLKRIEDSARNAGFHQADYCKIKRFIAKTPTIEAEPVWYGEWITDDMGKTHCSKCMQRIPYVVEYDTDDEIGGAYDIEINETLYCPHCGAIMDGGANDDVQKETC